MATNITRIEACCRGRFKAIAHKGHTFNEDGTIAEHGEIVSQSEFGNNKITLNGFNWMLDSGSGPVELHMAAGSGNTAPSESDVTLVAYLGKTSNNVIIATPSVRNDVPDVDGFVTHTTTVRQSFYPGSLGSGAKNVAEAAVLVGPAVSTNGSTPVIARGLLVDGGGAPTTVSLDASSEYLDIIWELTLYVPAYVTGTVTLTIDGVDVVHDYESSPLHFDSGGDSWKNRQTGYVCSYTYGKQAPGGIFQEYGWHAFHSSLAAIQNADPTGTYNSANVPDVVTPQTYTPNSKTRSVLATWLPASGNVVSGISLVRSYFGEMAMYQTTYDPPIAKVLTKQLDLMFTITLANKV